MNLAEAAAKFVALGTAVEANKKEALEQACVVIKTEAKRVLGTHDYGWPPLKPETIARKANGDTPLLETGELRDSIEHSADSQVGHIGSNNDKAVWHELGTSRGIPPRPFIAGAAQHKEKEVVALIGKVVFKLP